MIKLGKKPARHDMRVKALSLYTKELTSAPASVDWSPRLSDLGMMMNDQLGDCTCAAIGHLIQTWTAVAGQQYVPSDQDVLQLYEQACGYDPSDPTTDGGGIEQEVLQYWHRNGTIMGDHGLDAFVTVEPRNHPSIKNAVWLLGGAYIGVLLPVTVQGQSEWNVPPGGPNGDGIPGSWGGHAVPVIGYDDRGLTFITWGALARMSWSFWDIYCDEAYGLLSQDWISDNGDAPSGFDIAALRADMADFR